MTLTSTTPIERLRESYQAVVAEHGRRAAENTAQLRQALAVRQPTLGDVRVLHFYRAEVERDERVTALLATLRPDFEAPTATVETMVAALRRQYRDWSSRTDPAAAAAAHWVELVAHEAHVLPAGERL